MTKGGLPEVLVSRYRRYKSGTAQVVQWLGRTAKEHCDLVGRLAWLKDNKSATVFRLKIHELLAIANIIVKSSPPITVPQSLLHVLEDVIAGRQECGSWYSSQAIGDDTELAKHNHTHAFLVTVLRKILERLETLDRTEDTPNKKNRTNSEISSPEEINNLFAHLELEEPSGTPLGQKVPEKAAKKQHTLKFVMEDQDDGDFALWCLLADLSETRLFLRDIWMEYRQGAISIDVAGMVTETAFGMMRRAHEEFLTDHPKFSSWLSVVDHLQLSICVNRNLVYAFSRKPGAFASRDDAGAKPNDLTCLGAGLLLSTFKQGAKYSLASVVQRGRDGGQVIHENVGLLDCVRPKNSLEAPLLSLLPVLVAIKGYDQRMNTRKSQHLATSPFIDGLIDLIDVTGSEQEVPIWLVFACQVCMDADYLTESKRQLGGDAALRTGRKHKEVIEQLCHFYQQPHSKGFDGTNGNGIPADRKRELDELLQQARLVLDAVEEIRTSFQPHQRITEARAKQLYSGLDLFPHCAGYASWALKVRAYNVGCAISNNQSVVVMLAHFYELARKHRLIMEDWHDLEFVIARHSGRKPLITKTNANADPYATLRHFLIDLGVEVSAFSGKKQPSIPSDKVIAARGKTIRASSGSELLSVANEQFREDELRGHARADAFDIALSSLAEKSTTPKTKAKHKNKNKKHFSTNQLLSTLKAHLIDDEPNVNFDYIGFTEKCLELLQLTAVLGSHGKDPSYRACLYMTMKTAADAEAHNKPVSATPFAHAAVQMQKYIQASGDKFIKEALALSSGTISEQLRPELCRPLPDMSTAVEKLAAAHQDICVGSSRGTVEMYDPTGSSDKFEEILKAEYLKSFVEGGENKFVQTFSSAGVEVKPTHTFVNEDGVMYQDDGFIALAFRMLTGQEML